MRGFVLIQGLIDVDSGIVGCLFKVRASENKELKEKTKLGWRCKDVVVVGNLSLRVAIFG